MASTPVISLDQLASVYDTGKVAQQTERINSLVEKFQAIYGEKPGFVARSPGRVNIIGEHIDYSYFGVLPMAIDRDILIAVRAVSTNKTVKVQNVNAKHAAREFEHSADDIVTINAAVHEWSNYFKCGYKGIHERLKLNIAEVKGMEVLVDGNVPSGAGLSSSSAFVCCSALATLHANGKELTKKELAEIAIVSERYVGVNSGGMDQTCSIMGVQSNALFIEFYPSLKATPVAFPTTTPPMSFVIADSLVVADKHVSAPTCYNLRVVETRVASLALSHKLGLPAKETLREVMDAYFKFDNTSDRSVGTWISQLVTMLDLVEEHLTQKEGYTLDEMASLAATTTDDLVQKYMTRFPVRASVFHLYRRAHHVFSESLRVIRFRDVCGRQEAAANSGLLLFEELGNLMDESQASCKSLFECSCPELDDITSIARRCGAYGSRLSGAGWGGATISLVPEPEVEGFIAAMKRDYYKARFPHIEEEKLSDYIFATKAGAGAVIIAL